MCEGPALDCAWCLCLRVCFVCTWSTYTIIRACPSPRLLGGTHPINHGRTAVTPTIGARQRRLCLTSCSLSPPPCTAEISRILPPTQHPCIQLPSTTHSHPPHGMSVKFVKLCCEIFLSKSPKGHILGVPSVNPQPWRFTNNSLGLPPAHFLSVCLFL